ncbi:MAG TPA: hypothetical protein VMU30_06770 [Bacteroidota bacterium]|nr:hypothetical protein [Bacteroidota bacterium]
MIARGQEQKKISKDTAVTEMRLYDLPLPFEKPELTLPPSLKVFSANYSREYLRSSLTTPCSLTDKMSNELQSIWQNELAKENEGKTWKTILSSVQMGGTAYLLYEHIHKYGLK